MSLRAGVFSLVLLLCLAITACSSAESEPTQPASTATIAVQPTFTVVPTFSQVAPTSTVAPALVPTQTPPEPTPPLAPIATLAPAPVPTPTSSAPTSVPATPTIPPSPTATLVPTPPATATPTRTPTPTSTPTALWRPAAAPANASAYSAEWISVDVPGGKTMLAAVFRPAGTGLFPAVTFLHGTGGFQTPVLEIGQLIAQNGMIGIAVCWFGGQYQGTTNPTPAPPQPVDIACPNAPTIPTADPAGISASASQISGFLAAVRTLPGVKSDSIALGGVSRGSIAATAVAFTGESLKAVVAVAGYTPAFYGQALQAPVLVLQGTADTVIPEQDARNFENGLRAQGKTVEAYYYQGAPHELFFMEPWKTQTRVQAIAFLKAKFGI